MRRSGYVYRVLVNGSDEIVSLYWKASQADAFKRAQRASNEYPTARVCVQRAPSYARRTRRGEFSTVKCFKQGRKAPGLTVFASRLGRGKK